MEALCSCGVKVGPEHLAVWLILKNVYMLLGTDTCVGIVHVNRTYQSWSPALHAALPRSLAMEFTHHLTYHSGLTDQVVLLMRSSFCHSIGPGPFAELICTNHLRRQEQLHLQYLEMVYTHVQAPLARLLAKFEPFGDFDDRDGYAGFTPSANYF